MGGGGGTKNDEYCDGGNDAWDSISMYKTGSFQLWCISKINFEQKTTIKDDDRNWWQSL